MLDKKILEEIPYDDSFKAFIVTFLRMVYNKPEVLLYLEKENKHEQFVGEWKKVYEELKNTEKAKEALANLNEISKEFDWKNVEGTFKLWGEFGWVLYPITNDISLWDKKPKSQSEADKYVLTVFTKKDFQRVLDELKKETHNERLFTEAVSCFKNRLYAACASLLFSLIDGELISSKANVLECNKKTGAKASERVTKNVKKDEAFGLPGFFHLQLINFESFMAEYFKNAEGFKKEPKNLNRNYLHHGMSKRKVLRKDCIKLFLAYKQAIDFSNHKFDNEG